MPKYKLICEGYSDKYVMNDFELPCGKPEHLITRDEHWASLLENGRKGMERHYKEDEERCGRSDRGNVTSKINGL